MVEKDTSLIVHNALVERENLALSKPVSSNSSIDQGTGWNKNFLTDGQLYSDGNSYGYTSTNYNTDVFDVWVEIDLQQDTTFNRIQMLSLIHIWHMNH